ncbi:MAG TPA: S1C family serine protease [Rhodocyclaceae bacterium]|nr:S1C family serine protease [Rhodocyclaceae bacterium]
MNAKFLLLALSAALAGMWQGPAMADPAKVKVAEENPIIVFPDGTQGRPSFLKSMKTRFETPNVKIGELQKGWLCATSGDLAWSSKAYNAVTPRMPKIFRAELEKAHYPTPKVSDAIFDEPKDKSKSEAELHVGMFIKEVAASFCVQGEGTLGGVYLKIFWQVYSPEVQKVVFETTTEGSYQPVGFDKGADVFFDKAFAVASRNFLAQKGFYDAVTGPMPVEAKAGAVGAPETLKLKTAKPYTEPLAKNVTTLRSAVVTIFGEVGSGSGFFVSQDGYLLTNRHVVGNARFVKVKLITGRELVGEVIRTDKLRDVALVKTEPIAVQPIAYRGSEPNIGEEVYALGSPLGDRFNTSLTRGILSGYRTMDEQRYLQSDVAILPGNSGGPLLDTKGAVVGITVAGLGAKGLAGMNFFIPIADAFAKLGVEPN